MAEVESAKQLISGIGKQLAALKSCPNKDQLIKLLKQAADALPDLDQLATLKPVIAPLSCSLVHHGLLQHKDKDVRLLVAICFCEILRILAPNPDFSDAVFKDIFKLFLSLFLELEEKRSPYFLRRLKVLETVAKLRFCVLMLDTVCEDLVLRMFDTFFRVIREDHPQSLFSAMSSIMAHILKEKVPLPAVNMILQNLLKAGKGASPAASRLALSIVQDCTAELEHHVCEFLTACIVNRDAVRGELKEFYHEIIFEIFQCAPQMLLAVIPNLTRELLADQVDVRIKAVNLIGRLLVLPGHHVAQEYRHLFVEFLKRFSDKSAEVRIAAISCAKAFYIVNPLGAESREVLTALGDRLLDFDDRVRTQAVVIVCDLARANLKSLPPEIISRATERLRDKKVSVRKKALQKLLEVYRDYCTKCSAGIISSRDHFEQIPCRILMLCYDKDCKEFRPQNMELVLAEELFPASLSIEERTRHWIFLFTLFSPPHLKALNTILSQKRRLQSEMQVYLALRNRKEDIRCEEVEERIQNSVAKMSAFFPDSSKAEESFQKLNLLQDNVIFATLTQLLDEATVESAQMTRENFLKKIGNRHPHFEFLQLLSKKCLFNIFSSEHVQCILYHLLSDNFGDNRENPSVKLLLVITSAFPSLLRSLEKQFQLLLAEGKIPVNEELIQMLAKAGPYIRIKFSDIYPLLERICLDGTRTQAKLAVSAIAALVDASEKLVFTELCKKLVDVLHSGGNIPTVLQSLGCMAQYSVSTFESRGGEIFHYIVENIFQLTDATSSMDPIEETPGNGVSSKWKLQIFGLKTLVKSFLPHRPTTFGHDINHLFDVLPQMLQNGYISDGAIPCEADKANIRLAAAKSVLRLSRKWDLHIPPQLFHLTILIAKDSSSSVRRHFIDKIHKLLKHHAVPNKYACAFALAASDSLKDLQDNSLNYMEEFVRDCSREARIRQTTSRKLPVTDNPAYIVVFLIHVLAHDMGFPLANCEDEEIYAQFLSPLVLVLRALVSSSFVDGDRDFVNVAVSCLRSSLFAIKKAEDAVDVCITPKLHMLADIGITILNALTHNTNLTSHTLGLILLPSSLYRIIPAEKREEVCSNSLGQCPFNAKIVKKVVSSFESQISQSSGTLVKPGQKVQEVHSQLDTIKCSMTNLELCKNDDLSMNARKEIQCSYTYGQEIHEAMKLDIKTKLREKRVRSPSPPRQVGLHNEFSIYDEEENGVLVNPEPQTGREQFPSCDSATAETSPFQMKDLHSSAALRANGMMLNSNDNGTKTSKFTRVAGLCSLKGVANSCQELVGQRIKLWSLVDKCYYSGTVVEFDSRYDTHKITYDNGEIEVVSLGTESWETITDDLQREKDSNDFSSQRCCSDLVITRTEMDDASPESICRPKKIINKEKRNISKRRFPLPGKENKRHNICTETPESEIINVNDEPIARRTRRRK